MARTSVQIQCKDISKTKEIIRQLLSKSGYKEINQNNEMVWKKGTGFLTAMQYIKVEYHTDNKICISGWIRAAAGNEMDLTGVVGALPKKSVLKVIKQLQSSVK